MLEFEPMEPIKTTKIPQTGDWIHELKFDGVRGILKYRAGQFELYTKKGNDILAKFPEITGLTEVFKGDSAIIDGELTVWNGDKHSFHDILLRSRSSTEQKIKSNVANYPLTYVMFDIVSYNDKDLTRRSLLERKRILKECTSQNNTFVYSDYYSDGHALFEKVKSLGYEGIVSKKADSCYLPQKKHEDWFKIKVMKKMLAVVGGVRLDGDRIKSLLVGVYRDKDLYFVGNVYSGLSQRDIALLSESLSPLIVEQSPFANLPQSESTVFIKPMITCWIKFLEWSNSGKLRHPQILGFSNLSPNHANGEEISI